MHAARGQLARFLSVSAGITLRRTAMLLLPFRPRRSLLLRSQASTPEVRALHGLLREVEARLQAAPPSE